jgi:hypothetical protein
VLVVVVVVEVVVLVLVLVLVLVGNIYHIHNLFYDLLIQIVFFQPLYILYIYI